MGGDGSAGQWSRVPPHWLGSTLRIPRWVSPPCIPGEGLSDTLPLSGVAPRDMGLFAVLHVGWW